MPDAKWTHFHDMHSGGGQKLEWGHIYIEADLETAKVIFYNRFGRNPERVTCTCCGEDYAISEHDSLRQATAFQRNCANLKTPRVDGRYVAPDDQWWHDHYYLEPEDVAEAERRGWDVEENIAVKVGRDSGSDFGRYFTVEEWLDPQRSQTRLGDSKALAIYAHEIKPQERNGSVPEEGYVWR